MNVRSSKCILIAYAAIGPLLWWSLYTAARNHGLLPARESLDDVVLCVAIASGGCCAFLGMPGHPLLRAGVALLYAVSMTFGVLVVALYIECARGNCL